MNPLVIVKLLIALLPEIFSAIQAAERAFGPSKGADKLAHAVDLVGKAIPADAAEHAESVKDLLPVAISAAVNLMNLKGELPASAPAEVAPASGPQTGP